MQLISLITVSAFAASLVVATAVQTRPPNSFGTPTPVPDSEVLSEILGPDFDFINDLGPGSEKYLSHMLEVSSTRPAQLASLISFNDWQHTHESDKEAWASAFHYAAPGFILQSIEDGSPENFLTADFTTYEWYQAVPTSLQNFFAELKTRDDAFGAAVSPTGSEMIGSSPFVTKTSASVSATRVPTDTPRIQEPAVIVVAEEAPIYLGALPITQVQKDSDCKDNLTCPTTSHDVTERSLAEDTDESPNDEQDDDDDQQGDEQDDTQNTCEEYDEDNGQDGYLDYPEIDEADDQDDYDYGQQNDYPEANYQEDGQDNYQDEYPSDDKSDYQDDYEDDQQSDYPEYNDQDDYQDNYAEDQLDDYPEYSQEDYQDGDQQDDQTELPGEQGESQGIYHREESTDSKSEYPRAPSKSEGFQTLHVTETYQETIPTDLQGRVNTDVEDGRRVFYDLKITSGATSKAIRETGLFVTGVVVVGILGVLVFL